ncbi:hypothetical protein [Legionella sp. W05-934-2]|uniref:hypothetical protein n=1 Tax=Legionella sp. W05-934-2 TaxID=1198649 RepID=UPI003462CDD9
MLRKLTLIALIFPLLISNLNAKQAASVKHYTLQWNIKINELNSNLQIKELYSTKNLTILPQLLIDDGYSYLQGINIETGKQQYVVKLPAEHIFYSEIPAFIFGDKLFSYGLNQQLNLIFFIYDINTGTLIEKILTDINIDAERSIKDVKSFVHLYQDDIYLTYVAPKAETAYKITKKNSARPVVTRLFQIRHEKENMDQTLFAIQGMFYKVNSPEYCIREIKRLDDTGQELWTNRENFEYCDSEVPFVYFNNNQVIVNQAQITRRSDNIGINLTTTLDATTGKILSNYQFPIHASAVSFSIYTTLDKNDDLLLLDNACTLRKLKHGDQGYKKLAWQKSIPLLECYQYDTAINPDGSQLIVTRNFSTKNDPIIPIISVDVESGKFSKRANGSNYTLNMYKNILMIQYQNSVTVIDTNTWKILDDIEMPEKQYVQLVRHTAQGLEIYTTKYLYFYTLDEDC